MRARQMMTTALGLALVATAIPYGADAARQRSGDRAQRQASDQGLCRRAPALPVLPPETSYQQQQQHPGWMARRGGRDYPASPMVKAAPVEVSAEAGRAMVDSAVPAPPPPPPPAGSISAEPGYAAGASERADDRRIAPPYPMPPRPRPYPQPQSGLLTAGEHDDLLNPQLYARYVDQSNLGQRLQGLPQLDTARVLTVVVEDRAGWPVPFANVRLTCTDGNSLSLTTTADGKAVFFPGLDRLGRSVTVNVSAGGAWTGSRSVAISGEPGGQTIGVTTRGAAAAVRKFDLALVVDTTGSMGDEIAYLQSELRAILDALRRSHPQLDIRIGFVFYRDIGDSYVTATTPFTGNFASAQSVLAKQFASGGGDYPEAVDQAMIRAAGLAWRPDAVKSMLLVADAPPHDDKFGMTWAATEVARAKRIQIVPVAASGVADEAEYVMRAMAALTQSRYLFLTDDSGIGNPHAPPAIDCYLVTRLDALVRRVLDSQISGRRIEPGPQEVIRSVGDYDNGKCRLPRDAGQYGGQQR